MLLRCWVVLSEGFGCGEADFDGLLYGERFGVKHRVRVLAIPNPHRGVRPWALVPEGVFEGSSKWHVYGFALEGVVWAICSRFWVRRMR